jgi:alpha-glucosidase
MRTSLITIVALFVSIMTQAQNSFEITSPNQNIKVLISTGEKTTWSVLGRNSGSVSQRLESENGFFKTPFYKKAEVHDQYNQITLSTEKAYGIIFRAYNDGVAYRFFTQKEANITIENEIADFNFSDNHKLFIPYVRDFRSDEQWMQSFEATYDEHSLSETKEETMAFLPIMVALADGKKAVITEVDLQDYPGMYLQKNEENLHGLKATFAPVILETYQGGIGNMNTLSKKRANYIAQVEGNRSFPWRTIIISSEDKELLNNDMVQKLAEPSRITDESWIKPGKIAWDWWNDWQLAGVDFKAGINTETYKYYIDFAQANGLEYIIIDDGWSSRLDLFELNSELDLEVTLAYAKSKNVGVILWSSWYAFTRDMEGICKKYSEMGVVGFKVDFFDRDDQEVLRSVYEMSEMAAKYKLLMDYHGFFKPQGLQRTYPNVLNFEGVKGLENVKWTPDDDVPRYDTSLPFIRQVAGPMDYTPGAMRNRNLYNFRPSHSMPMSQGTRAHQVAMYVLFEAPLQMLADSPTAYMKEKETTDFIAQMPTIFDETVPLLGTVAEEVAVARKKDGVWYVGAMGNWQPREIEIDFSFLGDGNFHAEIFKDGINASRNAEDYKIEKQDVNSMTKLKVQVASGGGWAAIIKKL